jgi:hypothetical protein
MTASELIAVLSTLPASAVVVVRLAPPVNSMWSMTVKLDRVDLDPRSRYVRLHAAVDDPAW